MKSQLVTIENQSTVVSDHELFDIAYALNYQAQWHLGKSPWGVSASVQALPWGKKPPVGAWNLILLDKPPTGIEEGVLGFHEDEEGTEIPYSEVFCETAREDGTTPCAVASHELLELLLDPYTDKPRTVTHKGKIYIIEICDPVQGQDYDLGDPKCVKTGLMVSDFCYPAWYGSVKVPIDPSVHIKYSFRDSVSQPFTLSPEGYCSTAPVNEPTNFKPVFGDRINKLPNWASRLPRLHKT